VSWAILSRTEVRYGYIMTTASGMSTSSIGYDMLWSWIRNVEERWEWLKPNSRAIIVSEFLCAVPPPGLPALVIATDQPFSL